ncbi:MAG: GGDEF domain-containing protein [Hyphomonadaceae bacterium]
MRFLSIFSPRRRATETSAESAGDVAPVERRPDTAALAARTFGVPPQQLTPQVRAAFNAMYGEIESLREDVAQLKLDLLHAEEAADHDGLLAIYNRRAFMREASRINAMVRRHEIEASLIFFDLNTFKDVNDVHGHPAGDAVLRSVAETLLRQTRETDIVGRIGGDEFAVVLSHVSPEAARAKAEALGAAVRTERILHDGVALSISAAIGVADFDGVNPVEKVLALADEAMYADKKLHRRASA